MSQVRNSGSCVIVTRSSTYRRLESDSPGPTLRHVVVNLPGLLGRTSKKIKKVFSV